MNKPKSLLARDVSDELTWDPLLDGRRILVEANDGRITLTGAVDTYFDLIRASEDAESVRGVKDVDNLLLVGPLGEVIADASIAADCKAALDADRFVPAGAVTPQVTDGWVTLSGHVHRHYQRRAAERAVEKLKGVLGLSNQIVVSDEPLPEDVNESIRKALRRNALIDDSLIKVSSSDHTVYLDGMSGSWAAKEKAEEIASGAPRVAEVVNRITIVP
ncbi:MAG: BON domain-containing protein [Acidimicrobiales bacterium]|jgi:osmotically-inducible protein OsmY